MIACYVLHKLSQGSTHRHRRSSRTIPLHVFLKEAQAATDSTDACCEYLVSRLVSLHGPGGTIHGNQHALQSYLKKGDDLLNYRWACNFSCNYMYM